MGVRTTKQTRRAHTPRLQRAPPRGFNFLCSSLQLKKWKRKKTRRQRQSPIFKCACLCNIQSPVIHAAITPRLHHTTRHSHSHSHTQAHAQATDQPSIGIFPWPANFMFIAKFSFRRDQESAHFISISIRSTSHDGCMCAAISITFAFRSL